MTLALEAITPHTATISTGLLAGTLFALVTWLVAVAFAVPVWTRVVLESSRPVPYLHRASLVGLVLFGCCFGACYALLRRMLEPGRSTPRR